MKARVKATGDIVEVIKVRSYINEFGTLVGEYKTVDGIMYSSYDLDFYIEEGITIPDYWEKLKHQYAGMAMQGLVANQSIIYGQDFNEALDEYITVNAVAIAHALVEKIKEKEERK